MDTVINEKWFLRPRPLANPLLRLFCLSYAGGGASVFHKWADELPPRVELCAIQLPGRETRFSETPYVHLDPLVNMLANIMEPLTDTAFAIFGHSLGALIGFELARCLYRLKNIDPERLFLSAHRAPSVTVRESPISHLSDSEFVEAFRNRYHGIPKEIWNDRQLLDLFLPIMRSDMSILENYEWVPGIVLRCPLSVFGAADDEQVSFADLDAWRMLTTGPFSLRIFPGDHFFVRTATRDVIQAIIQDLDL